MAAMFLTLALIVSIIISRQRIFSKIGAPLRGKCFIMLILEHCAQRWVPVLRKNNATTQDLRAFSVSLRSLKML
jgi:hypothetical protein